MKTQKQRLNNLIGQLEGIKKMIDQNQDCFDILIQIKAAKSALSKIMNNHIKEHITNCLQFCGNNDDKDKLHNLLKELSSK